MPAPTRKHLVWPLAYTALILLLSSIPGRMESPGAAGVSLQVLLPASVQNLLHLPLFGGLALTWRITLPGLGIGPRTAAAWAAALALVTGLADEWHQQFVPGRFPSATDLILDGMGIALALGLYTGVRRRRNARRQ